MFLFLCPSIYPLNLYRVSIFVPYTHKKIGRLDCEPPKVGILDVIQGITLWTDGLFHQFAC